MGHAGVDFEFFERSLFDAHLAFSTNPFLSTEDLYIRTKQPGGLYQGYAVFYDTSPA
jgi:hypothetical protein